MSATVTTNVRGTDYRLVRLNPVVGGRLALRVGTLLAAVAEGTDTVKSLIDAYKTSQVGGEAAAAAGLLDSPALLKALAGGVARVDSDALYAAGLQCVTGNVFAGTRKLHDEDAFNDHFAQHPDHMFFVMAWAIKENCAGFFGLGAKA